MSSLFQRGSYRLHSGAKSGWKIECDALTEKDIETFALMISERYSFTRVKGVPKTQSTGLDNGGRLAAALEKFRSHPNTPGQFPGTGLLIVDDVLTTGASMNALYEQDASGVVLFARSSEALRQLPWVRAVFTLWGL